MKADEEVKTKKENKNSPLITALQNKIKVKRKVALSVAEVS